MTKTIHGRLHGKIIELDEDLGVPPGQEVEVEVRIVVPADSEKPARRLGTMQGSVTHMSDDFDAPLDDFQEYMS